MEGGSGGISRGNARVSQVIGPPPEIIHVHMIFDLPLASSELGVAPLWKLPGFDTSPREEEMVLLLETFFMLRAWLWLFGCVWKEGMP